MISGMKGDLSYTKEDYYYDGQEWLEEGASAKARRCFRKALEMDDEYVDACNGLGCSYFDTRPKTAREWYQRAYGMTIRHFKGRLPARIEWGILENRQYLRAMHGLGLLKWREGDTKGAMGLFALMLELNPNDNQGARYLMAALHEGLSWEAVPDSDDCKAMEAMFQRQNAKHGFFKEE